LNKPALTINIPNIITVLRILLVPVFVILLMKEMLLPALLVFTIAGISDGLDGFIARYFNQRTELGACLDPIADKLLIVSAFVSLAILRIIPGWLTVIVISRDILILLGIAICSFADVEVEIRPSFVSKCTTFAQLLTVFTALFNHDGSYALILEHAYWLYGATAVLTVISGLHYTYAGLTLLQESSKVNGQAK